MKLSEKYPHELDARVAEDPDYENNHIYLIDGKPHIELGYKSVTTFIAEFFDKFDADAIIDKYYSRWQSDESNKYYGMTKEEIIRQWDEKRIDSAEKGTFMHKQFENYVNGEETQDVQEMPHFLKWMEESQLIPFRSEMTIFHPEWKLVGNVDLLALNEFGEMVIVDYKRSERPSEKSYGRTIKELNIPQSPDIKHILQLNIYRHIFEQMYGFRIAGLYNLYIKEDYVEYVQQPTMNLVDYLEKIGAED